MKTLIMSLVLLLSSHVVLALMLDSMQSVELSKTLIKFDHQMVANERLVSPRGGVLFDIRCSSSVLLGHETSQLLTKNFFKEIKDESCMSTPIS